MSTWAEIKTAILKGLGRWPTSYLLRWSPSFQNPFHLDLVEVSRCEADGMVVTPKKAQSSVGIHLGHQVKNPRRYSLWEVFLVQLRVIQ